MTLFERIISTGNEGIPIHAIRAMFGEISRGEMAPADIVAQFSLDAGQQADLQTFLVKLNSHPDKVYLGIVMFDLLLLGERGIKPEVYRDEPAFWARIDAEIAKATAAP